MTIITYTVFFPLIWALNVDARFGAYWYGDIDTRYIVPGQYIKIDANWMDTEPMRRLYDWQDLDSKVGAIRAAGGKVLINIHNTPIWARGEYTCSLPPDISHLVRFAVALAARYKLEAIEIWNEPEVSGDVSYLMGWCCGCVTPADYATAMRAVYAPVKATSPDTQVLGGALLYDDSAWVDEMLTYAPPMDGLSWHSYTTYPYLSTARLTMQTYHLDDLTDAPLWLTETAMICHEQVCDDMIRFMQPMWLDAVSALPIDKVFWFSQNNVGWRMCNMVDENQGVTYPVYDLFHKILTSIQK